MVAQTKAELGRVDILVNDAAFNKTIQFPDLDGMTHELWNHIMTTNLTSAFICSRAVAPLMKAQGRDASSTSPPVPASFPRQQHRLRRVQGRMIHLTKCMAVALAPQVTVNSVSPGFHGRHAHEREPAADYDANRCRALRS
jgi:3-oxoacyl-[acyl-carrier protein] reductase